MKNGSSIEVFNLKRLYLSDFWFGCHLATRFIYNFNLIVSRFSIMLNAVVTDIIFLHFHLKLNDFRANPSFDQN